MTTPRSKQMVLTMGLNGLKRTPLQVKQVSKTIRLCLCPCSSLFLTLTICVPFPVLVGLCPVPARLFSCPCLSVSLSLFPSICVTVHLCSCPFCLCPFPFRLCQCPFRLCSCLCPPVSLSLSSCVTVPVRLCPFPCSFVSLSLSFCVPVPVCVHVQILPCFLWWISLATDNFQRLLSTRKIKE
jgi:hypothetical protein